MVDKQPYSRGMEKQGVDKQSSVENVVFELSEDKLDLLVQELTIAAKALDDVDQ